VKDLSNGLPFKRAPLIYLMYVKEPSRFDILDVHGGNVLSLGFHTSEFNHIFNVL
jgi:hypothetical protein